MGNSNGKRKKLKNDEKIEKEVSPNKKQKNKKKGKKKNKNEETEEPTIINNSQIVGTSSEDSGLNSTSNSSSTDHVSTSENSAMAERDSVITRESWALVTVPEIEETIGIEEPASTNPRLSDASESTLAKYDRASSVNSRQSSNASEGQVTKPVVEGEEVRASIDFSKITNIFSKSNGREADEVDPFTNQADLNSNTLNTDEPSRGSRQLDPHDKPGVENQIDESHADDIENLSVGEDAISICDHEPSTKNGRVVADEDTEDSNDTFKVDFDGSIDNDDSRCNGNDNILNKSTNELCIMNEIDQNNTTEHVENVLTPEEDLTDNIIELDETSSDSSGKSTSTHDRKDNVAFQDELEFISSPIDCQEVESAPKELCELAYKPEQYTKLECKRKLFTEYLDTDSNRIDQNNIVENVKTVLPQQKDLPKEMESDKNCKESNSPSIKSKDDWVSFESTSSHDWQDNVAYQDVCETISSPIEYNEVESTPEESFELPCKPEQFTELECNPELFTECLDTNSNTIRQDNTIKHVEDVLAPEEDLTDSTIEYNDESSDSSLITFDKNCNESNSLSVKNKDDWVSFESTSTHDWQENVAYKDECEIIEGAIELPCKPEQFNELECKSELFTECVNAKSNKSDQNKILENVHTPEKDLTDNIIELNKTSSDSFDKPKDQCVSFESPFIHDRKDNIAYKNESEVITSPIECEEVKSATEELYQLAFEPKRFTEIEYKPKQFTELECKLELFDPVETDRNSIRQDSTIEKFENVLTPEDDLITDKIIELDKTSSDSSGKSTSTHDRKDNVAFQDELEFISSPIDCQEVESVPEVLCEFASKPEQYTKLECKRKLFNEYLDTDSNKIDQNYIVENVKTVLPQEKDLPKEMESDKNCKESTSLYVKTKADWVSFELTSTHDWQDNVAFQDELEVISSPIDFQEVKSAPDVLCELASKPEQYTKLECKRKLFTEYLDTDRNKIDQNNIVENVKTVLPQEKDLPKEMESDKNCKESTSLSVKTKADWVSFESISTHDWQDNVAFQDELEVISSSIDCQEVESAPDVLCELAIEPEQFTELECKTELFTKCADHDSNTIENVENVLTSEEDLTDKVIELNESSSDSSGKSKDRWVSLEPSFNHDGQEDVTYKNESEIITSIECEEVENTPEKSSKLACEPKQFIELESKPEIFTVLECDLEKFSELCAEPKSFPELASNPKQFTDLSCEAGDLLVVACEPEVSSKLAFKPKDCADFESSVEKFADFSQFENDKSILDVQKDCEIVPHINTASVQEDAIVVQDGFLPLECIPLLSDEDEIEEVALIQNEEENEDLPFDNESRSVDRSRTKSTGYVDLNQGFSSFKYDDKKYSSSDNYKSIADSIGRNKTKVNSTYSSEDYTSKYGGSRRGSMDYKSDSRRSSIDFKSSDSRRSSIDFKSDSRRGSIDYNNFKSSYNNDYSSPSYTSDYSSTAYKDNNDYSSSSSSSNRWDSYKNDYISRSSTTKYDDKYSYRSSSNYDITPTTTYAWNRRQSFDKYSSPTSASTTSNYETKDSGFEKGDIGTSSSSEFEKGSLGGSSTFNSSSNGFESGTLGSNSYDKDYLSSNDTNKYDSNKNSEKSSYGFESKKNSWESDISSSRHSSSSSRRHRRDRDLRRTRGTTIDVPRTFDYEAIMAESQPTSPVDQTSYSQASSSNFDNSFADMSYKSESWYDSNDHQTSSTISSETTTATSSEDSSIKSPESTSISGSSSSLLVESEKATSIPERLDLLKSESQTLLTSTSSTDLYTSSTSTTSLLESSSMKVSSLTDLSTTAETSSGVTSSASNEDEDTEDQFYDAPETFQDETKVESSSSSTLDFKRFGGESTSSSTTTFDRFKSSSSSTPTASSSFASSTLSSSNLEMRSDDFKGSQSKLDTSSSSVTNDIESEVCKKSKEETTESSSSVKDVIADLRKSREESGLRRKSREERMNRRKSRDDNSSSVHGSVEDILAESRKKSSEESSSYSSEIKRRSREDLHMLRKSKEESKSQRSSVEETTTTVADDSSIGSVKDFIADIRKKSRDESETRRKSREESGSRRNSREEGGRSSSCFDKTKETEKKAGESSSTDTGDQSRSYSWRSESTEEKSSYSSSSRLDAIRARRKSCDALTAATAMREVDISSETEKALVPGKDCMFFETPRITQDILDGERMLHASARTKPFAKSESYLNKLELDDENDVIKQTDQSANATEESGDSGDYKNSSWYRTLMSKDKSADDAKTRSKSVGSIEHKYSPRSSDNEEDDKSSYKNSSWYKQWKEENEDNSTTSKTEEVKEEEKLYENSSERKSSSTFEYKSSVSRQVSVCEDITDKSDEKTEEKSDDTDDYRNSSWYLEMMGKDESSTTIEESKTETSSYKDEESEQSSYRDNDYKSETKDDIKETRTENDDADDYKKSTWYLDMMADDKKKNESYSSNETESKTEDSPPPSEYKSDSHFDSEEKESEATTKEEDEEKTNDEDDYRNSSWYLEMMGRDEETPNDNEPAEEYSSSKNEEEHDQSGVYGSTADVPESYTFNKSESTADNQETTTEGDTKTDEQTSSSDDYRNSSWYLALMSDENKTTDGTDQSVTDYNTKDDNESKDDENTSYTENSYTDNTNDETSTETKTEDSTEDKTTNDDSDYRNSSWYLALMGDENKSEETTSSDGVTTTSYDYETEQTKTDDNDSYKIDSTAEDTTEKNNDNETTTENNDTTNNDDDEYDYKKSSWYLDFLKEEEEKEKENNSKEEESSSNTKDTDNSENNDDKINSDYKSNYDDDNTIDTNSEHDSQTSYIASSNTSEGQAADNDQSPADDDYKNSDWYRKLMGDTSLEACLEESNDSGTISRKNSSSQDASADLTLIAA